MKKLKFFEGVKRERASDPEEKAFPSAVEIMNYTPRRYFYTTEWASFVNNASKSFQQLIAKARPDELNAGMLDAYIDSEYASMLAYVDEQRTEHEAVIRHHQMILSGQLVKLNNQIELLQQDLSAIEDAKARLLAEAAG